MVIGADGELRKNIIGSNYRNDTDRRDDTRTKSIMDEASRVNPVNEIA